MHNAPQETFSCDILSLSHDGRGVARPQGQDGPVVFVSGALPGQQVRARVLRRKSRHVEADCVEVLRPAPDAVPPLCPHADACGGCPLQRMPYAAQLRAREELLRQTLGEGVKVPEHYFTNHADPAVCNAAVDILTSDTNYVLSELWKRHDVYLDSEENRLSELIPRVVTLYKSKTIEAIIARLKERLTDETLSDEELTEIMENISALNEVRTKIAKKISRLIL